MCKGDAAAVLKTQKAGVISHAELATHNVPTDNWVAIDGQVYDISEYIRDDHPGGRYLPLQISGKDASCLFKSTHPKYVGQLLTRNPKIIHKGALAAPLTQFKYESEFYDVLQERVALYFKNNGLKRNYHKWGNVDNFVKVFLMATLWLLGWYFAAGWVFILAQSVVTQLFCFSVMHTNNHGGLTSDNRSRWYWDCIVDTCGGVSTIAWRHLHNICHHFCTNMHEHDSDIQNTPWFRFSVSQPRMWWHKYQHLYASVLMCLFPAVKMEFKHTYIAATLPNVDPADRLRWLCAKVFYWTMFIVLPAHWHGWQFALSAAYVRYVICSFMYTHVIAPTHVNEHCQHVTERDWFKHQVYTSSDSAPGGVVSNWFTAGLNHQIEHHLFPMIHHLHYPGLQPIIAKTIKEYNLPYNVQTDLFTAVGAYWHWLYKVGNAD